VLFLSKLKLERDKKLLGVRTPHEQYRAVHIETASQGNLVLMAYNGMIDSLKAAKSNIAERNIPEATQNLIRTQQLLGVLFEGLDFDAGEVALQLGSFYEYLRKLLMKANREKDEKLVDEALVLVTKVRATWAETLKKHSQTVGDSIKKVQPQIADDKVPRRRINFER